MEVNLKFRHRLRTKLSITITTVTLVTVLMTSYFSNLFINKQFTEYRMREIDNSTKELVNSIELQYSPVTKAFDSDFVHTIGMQALSNGFMITVFDNSGSTVWDAKTCDMNSCKALVETMTKNMQKHRPNLDGGFLTKSINLLQSGEITGKVDIVYYSPYFLNDNDLNFINGLNSLLLLIAIIALIMSFLVGFFISKRLSDPILKVVDATKAIAKGTYSSRVSGKTSTIEVVDLISSVNLLAFSLENQETLRKQLTADVAHELRTPITTLQTHLEAMLEGIWEPTQERLQSCHEEVLRIGKMVLDLENLAKAENNTLDLSFKTINLSELTSKVIKNFETDITMKNLSLEIISKHDDLYADEDRIYQVITNLISNAVKYTPENGSIKITISKANDSVKYSIKDNGIGIPSEDLPFVFERFYRADKSRNRNTGGSGIGLAIVRSIVNAHGGTVSVTSTYGEGSEFILSFPQ